MRILLHIGLGKSGTTTMQHAWVKALGHDDVIWYPQVNGAEAPSHSSLFRPFVSKISEGELPAMDSDGLRAVVDEALSRGVATLVLSCEELMHLSRPDLRHLRSALGSSPVDVLVSLTTPAHRWASAWQELVKHGMADLPNQAGKELLSSTALRAGRLQQLVSYFPDSKKTIRIVRTSPPERDLARAVLKAADVALGRGRNTVSPPLNTSIGSRIELLRRLNAIGVTKGIKGNGMEVFEKLSGAWEATAFGEFSSEFTPPRKVYSAAKAEYEFLFGNVRDPLVSVVDPHRLAQSWKEWEFPNWYIEIAQGVWEPVVNGESPSARAFAHAAQALSEMVNTHRNFAEVFEQAIRDRDHAAHLAVSLAATLEEVQSVLARADMVLPRNSPGK